MKFDARSYFLASIERIRQADVLLGSGKSYALSMYCSGLAVESLLRAFRWIEDDSFEGRHDIMDLLKPSRLLAINEEAQSGRIDVAEVERSSTRLRAAALHVFTLWRNNLRYASEERCLAFLRQIGHTRGVKGDPLRRSAQELLESAKIIINRGAILWAFARR